MDETHQIPSQCSQLGLGAMNNGQEREKGFQACESDINAYGCDECCDETKHNVVNMCAPAPIVSDGRNFQVESKT